MPPISIEPFPLALFGFTTAFALVTVGFFSFNKNAALKRKLFLPLLVAFNLLFVASVAAFGLPAELVLFMAFAGVVSIFIYLRTVRFCDSCGATNMSVDPLGKPTVCNKCGSNLK